MNVITRQQWGARPPRWRQDIRTSKGVFIHYNGASRPIAAPIISGDFEAVCAHLRQTQNWHMDNQGWPDIAYSFAVANDGNGGALIYELRGWGVAGAHTMGWNSDSHAIYFPITLDQAPTDAQVAAANVIIAEHNRRFGVGFVKGHQQAPNSTSCPGGPTMARILAGDFHGRPTPPPPPQPEEDDIMHLIVKDPRPGRSIWHVAGNTRYRLATPAEVNALRFMGVRYVEVNPGDPQAVEGVLNLLRACKDLGRK